MGGLAGILTGMGTLPLNSPLQNARGLPPPQTLAGETVPKWRGGRLCARTHTTNDPSTTNVLQLEQNLSSAPYTLWTFGASDAPSSPWEGGGEDEGPAYAVT